MFAEWETQLIKKERATSKARAVMNSLVELIDENFYTFKLISNYIVGKLPKVKVLEKQWKQDLASKDQ